MVFDRVRTSRVVPIDSPGSCASFGTKIAPKRTAHKHAPPFKYYTFNCQKSFVLQDMIRLAIFLALIQCTISFLPPTIPNFLPYLPRSIRNWIGSEPETRTVDTFQKDLRIFKDPVENPSEVMWDLTILPPSVWSNLLTSVRTEAPKTKEIQEDSYPVRMSRIPHRRFGYVYGRTHLPFG
ncbi:hypothetical protein Ddc_15587 [Ditylenchus destructor]|nr:hypothetical protein Ddc_15587 [Ditylenchus destructor]